MAGLLAPFIPDSSEWFKSRAQGYALGDTMRNRDLRVDAGGQAAEGDLKGAKATLYEGGDFEGGNQVHQMMRQASDDALKKTERFHATLGNLALAADTPEKWAAAVGAAQKAGLDVSKYGDFRSRDMLLAQSGKTIEAINMEAERRKAEAAARKPMELSPGATLYDPGTMKPVFTAPSAPPKPEGLRDVAPGSTVYDPAQGRAVFTAPMKQEGRTELERRAIAGGLQPDTPEYQEYVLSGPEKEARKSELARRAEEAGLIPGTPEYQKYVLAGPPKTSTEKWNEGQSKAANFGNMMVQAEDALTSIGPKDAEGKVQLGPDGKPLPAENPKNFLGATRDALVPFEGLSNVMTPSGTQEYNQIAKQWIRAKLRKESGAAIGTDEMAKEFTTYFPQYGDRPAVRKRKADAREEATKGMIAESAGAYDHFFGQSKEQGRLTKEAGAESIAPVQVQTPEEAMKLPPGTHFVTPDGRIKVRP